MSKGLQKIIPSSLILHTCSIYVLLWKKNTMQAKQVTQKWCIVSDKYTKLANDIFSKHCQYTNDSFIVHKLQRNVTTLGCINGLMVKDVSCLEGLYKAPLVCMLRTTDLHTPKHVSKTLMAEIQINSYLPKTMIFDFSLLGTGTKMLFLLNTPPVLCV